MTRIKSLETLLALGAALTLLSLSLKSPWPAWAALTLLLAGLLLPRFAAGLAAFWLKATGAVGFVISRLLLSAIYFLVLFPLGTLARLFRRDPLQLKRRGEGESYFAERKKEFAPGDLERPW